MHASQGWKDELTRARLDRRLRHRRRVRHLPQGAGRSGRRDPRPRSGSRADRRPTAPDATRDGVTTTGRDRAQYGLCAALAVLGVLLLADAARIAHATSSNDPVGPRPVPVILGLLLLVTAVLLRRRRLPRRCRQRRGGRGRRPLDRSDWKTLGLLAAFFVLNAVLIEPLGWVICGTILFCGLGLRPRQPPPRAQPPLRPGPRARHLLRLRHRARRQPARRRAARESSDGQLQHLIDGFGHVLTPMNLLFALIGVRSAPPSACCRASARP